MGRIGQQGGTGNPGHGHNIRVRELIGLTTDEALALFKKNKHELSPEDTRVRNEIMVKVVVKAVPSEINWKDETPERKTREFSAKEKELYDAILTGRTGVVDSSVATNGSAGNGSNGSTGESNGKELSTDVGDEESDGE